MTRYYRSRMFDSHCHLHSDRLFARAGELIARARDACVRGCALAAVDPESFSREAELARAHPGVYVSYGVHPQRVDEISDADLDQALEALACPRENPRPLVAPVALGEIGLDGVGPRRETLAWQERAFARQLALARR